MKPHFRILAFGWFVIASFVASSAAEAQGFPNLFGPSIPEISTEKLIQRLTDSEAMKKTVVVDVRTPAETAVSVIPGAITKSEYEANAAKYRDKQVIVYCTVGGRSANYAKQLVAKKIDVLNYKGSILAWVAAEQPLETLEGEPTKRVHTYSGRNKVPKSYQAVY